MTVGLLRKGASIHIQKMRGDFHAQHNKAAEGVKPLQLALFLGR